MYTLEAVWIKLKNVLIKKWKKKTKKNRKKANKIFIFILYIKLERAMHFLTRNKFCVRAIRLEISKNTYTGVAISSSFDPPLGGPRRGYSVYLIIY